ncbi:hypothetical protein [Amycolatopsis sp. FDAARGOS 1241]|uniref:SbtR family transcriptional regulator n=1 Tax=Amycolatopsis sp. FDAARGOS 1241 TaxID=2778070 RepID=UPI001EF284AE|nr:hypothetical protein [Amycolatopsis sp. FDAARGOS 1241]
MRQVAAAAERLLASRPPLAALREWLDNLAHHGMTKAGLGEALYTATTTHEGLAAETHEPVIGALRLLLEANEAAGTVRPGLDPDDVLLITEFLWRIDPTSDWRTRASRMLDLLVEGLRVGADQLISCRGSR